MEKKERAPGTMQDQMKAIDTISNSNVEVLLSEFQTKERLEKKAWSGLERRLTPRNKMCKPCKGEGQKVDGSTCAMCQGIGFVTEDADMDAIKLVLQPKFPKTQINVNAEVDGMNTDDLLEMIDKL